MKANIYGYRSPMDVNHFNPDPLYSLSHDLCIPQRLCDFIFYYLYHENDTLTRPSELHTTSARAHTHTHTFPKPFKNRWSKLASRQVSYTLTFTSYEDFKPGKDSYPPLPLVYRCGPMTMGLGTGLSEATQLPEAVTTETPVSLVEMP